MYLSLVDTPEEKDKFTEIYEQYRVLMFFYARRILGDDKLAEDAVQEAFFRIAKNIKKISEVKCDKTKHFVVIIVESAAKDIYRKEKRNLHSSWEKLETNYCSPTEQWALENGTLTETEEAILRLPHTYRQIFYMKYMLGYSNKEISQVLNIRQSALRMRISRGKAILAEILEEMGVYIGE